MHARAHLANCLLVRRVRMNHTRELGRTDAVLDARRDFGDHVTGVFRHDRAAENFVCSFAHVHLDKPSVVSALADVAVHVLQWARVPVAGVDFV